MAHAPDQPAFQIEMATPAGPVRASVHVPTGFVPITSIVPLLRRLGEEAEALEAQQRQASGASISCRQGCAACCRMLVPLSAPEAFALYDAIHRLPDIRRAQVLEQLETTRAALEAAGLLGRLRHVADADRPLTDEELDPLNRDYYSLRLACPFLEREACMLYEDRPSACRELLVTSPPEFCDDLATQPVEPVPVPIRMSTALGLLWAELRREQPRLIPLPLAVEWAERHAAERAGAWKGPELLQAALTHMAHLLEQHAATSGSATGAPSPTQP